MYFCSAKVCVFYFLSKLKVKIFFNFVDDVDIPVISEPIVTQTTYERRKTA